MEKNPIFHKITRFMEKCVISPWNTDCCGWVYYNVCLQPTAPRKYYINIFFFSECRNSKTILICFKILNSTCNSVFKNATLQLRRRLFNSHILVGCPCRITTSFKISEKVKGNIFVFVLNTNLSDIKFV